MAFSNRTFRVFVSSTFSDLKAERNALQEKVFPRLRNLAEAHGCHFQAIDLRWGVSEEAALDQQTMKICLGEIGRCQQVSPKPNFLILLGDRYGWRPIPYEILADEFEQLSNSVNEDDQTLLHRWYRRDNNALPPVYCLLPRSGEFVNFEIWNKIESQLHTIFQKALGNLSLSKDALIKYSTSATEQEIVAGALNVPGAIDHVFCFFRNIQKYPTDIQALTYYESDPHSAQIQSELKERLRKALPNNVHEYMAHWEKDQPSMDHLEQLCMDVYSELSTTITAEIEHLDRISALDHEISNHQIFGFERSRIFIGRNDILNTIERYLSTEAQHPLTIWGESGSGKSALMSKAIENAQKSGQEVIFRFIGVTPESSNGYALLQSLCRQVSRNYGVNEHSIPTEYKDLVKEFIKRLALATKEKPLVIFLDALDQLTDTHNARNLKWLPIELPQYVHLIVSTLPGDSLTVLEHKTPEKERIEIQPMSITDGAAILDCWLADINHTFQENQKNHLLEKFKTCGSPLYLKLAFEEARVWKSYTPLPDLKDNVLGIIGDLFARLSLESNHGAMVVSRSLGYLAAAKNGLSEDELLDILSFDKEVLADFQRRSPNSPKTETLPVVIWSRLYMDLEPYLTERSSDGTTLYVFYHRQLIEAVQNQFLVGEEKIKRHQMLASFFESKSLLNETLEIQSYNLRKLSEQPYQQTLSQMSDDLVNTLTNYSFLETKISAYSVDDVINDFKFALSHLANLPIDVQNSLQYIQDSIQLSEYILNKNKHHLAGQLFGRLSDISDERIVDLLSQARKKHDIPWLRPINRSLKSPLGSEEFSINLEGEFFLGISPDKKWIVTSTNGNFQAWDLSTGSRELTLKDPRETYLEGNPQIAFSSDGNTLAAAFRGGIIRIWELISGELIQIIKDPSIVYERNGGMAGPIYSGYVSDMMFVDQNQSVVSLVGGALKIWDVKTGKLLKSMEMELDTNVPVLGSVNKFIQSNNPTIIIHIATDETIRVWDLQTSECKLIISGRAPADISLNGEYLAATSADFKSINIWNLISGRKENSLQCDSAYKIIFLPDQQKVAIFGNRHQIWDTADDNIQLLSYGYLDVCKSVLVSEDEKFLLASDGNNLLIWNLENYELTHSIRNLGGTLDCHPDEQHVICCSNNKVTMLDPKKGISDNVSTSVSKIRCLEVTPDGLYAISTSSDKTIKFWRMDSALEDHQIPCSYAGNIYRFTFTPDGQRLVSIGEGGNINIISLTNPDLALKIKNEWQRYPVPILITPDGCHIIGPSEDNKVKTWCLNSPNDERIIGKYSKELVLSQLLITPDGKKIVSGSHGKGGTLGQKKAPQLDPEEPGLKVWDFTKPDQEHILHTQKYYNGKTCISPDGNRAYSIISSENEALSSYNKKSIIVCWDINTYQEETRIFYSDHQEKHINTFGITPDEKWFVGLTGDGLRIWNLLDQKEYTQSTPQLDKPVLSNLNSQLLFFQDANLILYTINGKNLFVFNLTSFTQEEIYVSDHEFTLMRLTPDGKMVIATDIIGGVNFLCLEGIDIGALVVTPWEYKSSGIFKNTKIAFGCPYCRKWSEIQKPFLGTLILCPTCNKQVKINPFTIKGDWHPIAKAWG